MAGGLYKSLYGKGGIYEQLYSKYGASPPTQRTDIRLGNYEYFGQAEDDDEENEEPEAPPANAGKPPIFAKEYQGFPIWLLGLFLLGFSWAFRRKKKQKGTSKTASE